MKSAHELVASARQQICEISPKQATEILAKQGTTLIDVREPQEFAAGHLPGAINLPRGLLEFKLAELPGLEAPETTCVLYCKSGGRAALCAVVLEQMGLPNVVSIVGGYDAWVSERLPVETPPQPSFE